MDERQRVAIIGGTGPQGRGLATRWAVAGRTVIIGSRDADRARQTAAEIGHGARGRGNLEAVESADLCVLTVPWEAHESTLRDLAAQVGTRIVVDCVNPLGFDKQGPFSLPVAEGSAAQQAQALLPDATVVAAFHHVSAVHLADLSIERFDQDVLVLGEDRDACAVVIELANAIPGMRGVFAGRLRNAGQVEALTANLIAINRRYTVQAGLKITDV